MSTYSVVAVIVGFPRSGTTLLRSMLAKNPQLDVLEVEAHYVLEMYQQFGHSLPDTQTVIRFLVDHRKFPERYADRDVVRSALEEFGPDSLSNLLNGFFGLLFSQTVNGTLVIKHPALVMHLDVVSALFPNAVVLNAVRDPRGAIASHRARWPARSVAEVSHTWSQAVTAALKMERRHVLTVINVCYEQLLTEPAPVLQEVCSALGVEFVPEMLVIDYEQKQWSESGPQKEYNRHFNSLDTSKIDNWRNKLDPVDLAIIERTCRDEMVFYGYVQVGAPLGVTEKAEYVWRKLNGQAHILARSVKQAVWVTVKWRFRIPTGSPLARIMRRLVGGVLGRKRLRS